MTVSPPASGHIHVWTLIPLPALPAEAPFVLDDSERERARRLRHPDDRHRFIAAHACLRVLLGSYLDIPAAAVRFARRPCSVCGAAHGKPILARRPRVGLDFNLAHSSDGALVAIGGDVEIGVDLERLSSGASLLAAAPAIFTSIEARALERQCPRSRDSAAAQLWTRKEAVLKAAGTGLAVSPTTIDVGWPGREHECIVAESHWFVRDLVLRDGYVGALAAASRPVRVVHYDWTRDVTSQVGCPEAGHRVHRPESISTSAGNGRRAGMPVTG